MAGEVGWLDAGLDAPVKPVQPELERIAESRRARAAKGIAFLPKEFVVVAYIRVSPNHFIV